MIAHTLDSFDRPICGADGGGTGEHPCPLCRCRLEDDQASIRSLQAARAALSNAAAK